MRIKPKRIITYCLLFVMGVAAVRGLPSFLPKLEKAAFLSAGLSMPEGGMDYISKELKEQDYLEMEDRDIPPEETENPDAETAAPEETKPEETEPQVVQQSKTPSEGEKGGDVQEKQFKGGGSSYIGYENIWVQNKPTSYTVDIKGLLEEGADLEIKKDENPYVLIYHTHTTESYLDGDYGWYPKNYTSRSLEENKNMIAVGNKIVEQLEAAGIGVIHVTDLFDYPSYNGAYDRTAAMIDEYKEKYPTLEVMLDVHRDAIQYDNGTKVKPTAVVDGKKAAQIMIASGCEEEPVTGFPDWKYNLRFALQLQSAAETKYPGLMRPLYFCVKKYNQYKSHNSLLIEMGTDGNTIEEAVYSGELLGKALVDVLNKYET